MCTRAQKCRRGRDTNDLYSCLCRHYSQPFQARGREKLHQKARTEKRASKLAEAVLDTKLKKEDAILTKKMDSARFASPPTDISDDTKNNLKPVSISTSMDVSYIHHYQSIHQREKRKQHCSTLQHHPATLRQCINRFPPSPA